MYTLTRNSILLLISFVMISSLSNAQMVSMTRTQTGLETGITVSGNGLAGHYAHGIYRKGTKSLIGAYVLTPYSCKSIEGGQVYLSRTLLDNSKSFTSVIGLHVFITGKYIKSSGLSNSSLAAMKVLAPEFNNAENIRYESVEAFAGLGLSGKLTQRLFVFVDLGVGSYKTLSSNDETIPVKFQNYRSDKDLVLSTKAGIRFKIAG